MAVQQLNLLQLMPPAPTITVRRYDGSLAEGAIGPRSAFTWSEAVTLSPRSHWHPDPDGAWFCISWLNEPEPGLREARIRYGLGDPDRPTSAGCYCHEDDLREAIASGQPLEAYQRARLAAAREEAA